MALRDRPLPWFAAAFAVAVLAHGLWWRGLPGTDLHGVVAALACLVLVRPSSRATLGALAAGEALSVAVDLPSVGDHRLLAGVTALVVLTTLGRADPWVVLAPFLRAQAVLLYGAAALAKLNEGFLDPATSCAGPLAAQLAPGLLDGRWHVAPAIVATVAVEASLALLLAVPRGRRAGLVLGLGFHAVLALAGNVPFAAWSLALYVAFAPASALPPARTARPAAVALAVLLVAGLLGPGELRLLLRLGLAAALVALAVLVVRRPGRAPLGVLRPVPVVALSLLAVNAASPYLGLRTEATFTMFSNLQTEPGHHNHLVVPEAVRVFGLQDDLVRVVASTSPTLERRRRAGVLMVRAELERVLRREPGARATYRLDGRLRRASAATLPDRPVADRLLNFYDVRDGARGRC